MSHGKPSRKERALSGSFLGGEPELALTPATPPMPLSATALFLVAFNALTPAQQEEVYGEISEARLRRIAGEDDELTAVLRSLRAISAHVGEELTPALYKAAHKKLRAAGESIHEFNQVVRFFGSWRRAKEALDLSETSTPFKIEARFRARMVGKVHSYREETLRQTLADCVCELGRVPLVIEFELWRKKEMELAKAQGKEVFIPSDSPYRTRWGTWEDALAHFGYDLSEIKARLEPSRERSNAALQPYQYGAKQSGQ